MFWGIPKIRTVDRPKNTRIPPRSEIVFKKMFDLMGFTYVLRCFLIFRFLKCIKIPPPKILSNGRRYQLFWTHQVYSHPPLNKKIKTNYTLLMSGEVGNFGSLGFPKWCYMKKEYL